MIGDEYFPAFVTHNTEQSRTLGAALDNLLGKTCPRAVLANPVTLCAVLIELWRNLPCVELESLLLCLPFYCAINCKQLPELTESGSLPETWQLNEELAQRLSFACDSREIYERVLARFGKEELELIIINNNEDYLFYNIQHGGDLIGTTGIYFVYFIWLHSISEIH